MNTLIRFVGVNLDFSNWNLPHILGTNWHYLAWSGSIWNFSNWNLPNILGIKENGLVYNLPPLLKVAVFFSFIYFNIVVITGDVLLHCVVDAILGALGLPDIGQIFPDNDPKWKGAPSSVFIKEAVSFFLGAFAF